MPGVNPESAGTFRAAGFASSASSASSNCGFHFIRAKMEDFFYFLVSESLPERRPAEA
jgi:hypothetical protein